MCNLFYVLISRIKKRKIFTQTRPELKTRGLNLPDEALFSDQLKEAYLVKYFLSIAQVSVTVPFL